MNKNKIDTSQYNTIIGLCILAVLGWFGHTVVDTHDIALAHDVQIGSIMTRLDSIDTKAGNWVTRQELNTKLYGTHSEYVRTNWNN
jgi:hypothetical protein